ncbi:MAG: hypothetical protein ACP5D8_01230 [Fidelibacterota bacterium]
MKYSCKKHFFLLLTLLGLTTVLVAEENSLDHLMGDRTARKSGIIAGNKVRTLFYNYGVVGGDITGSSPEGEWPIGSGNSYIGDVSILIGVELPRKWEKKAEIDENSIAVLDGVEYEIIDSQTYLNANKDTVRVISPNTIRINGIDYNVSRYFYSCKSLNIYPDSLMHLMYQDTVYYVGTNDGPRGATDGPGGASNMSWTFEPLPGFADPNQDYVPLATDLDLDGDGKPDTWPWFWPDHPDWVDVNGIPEWNGYFGRGISSADEETFFYMDDANDYEFNYEKNGSGKLIYLPDSTNSSRFGLGLRVKVRAMQWAHFMAQDMIFWLYEIENFSDWDYNKASFGMVVGTLSGGRCNDHIDAQDDLSYFDMEENMCYSWDAPPAYSPCFDGPVGYVGYAYLESPGNPYDGIDNDGDYHKHTAPAPQFTEEDFDPVTFDIGDQIVLIDGDTYEREVKTIEELPMTVTTQGRIVTIQPGVNYEEIIGNLVDDDFDGLIDENYNAHYLYRIKPLRAEVTPKPPLRYINYFTGAGIDNLMIDETRDDDIDNDGDWDPATDDVGADGKPGTRDEGEGDGLPTPGEPNLDATDIDESDQIGLTSFNYFTPPGKVRMNDDYNWDISSPGGLWNRMQPGNYDEISLEPVDGDFIYGAGYFPIRKGQTERFSLGLVYGNDEAELYKNKQVAQQIYDENYNFTRPPETPTVKVVPGDEQVTLYWDDLAEYSLDPWLGYDFEGYRIYRATVEGFNDINTITNAYGNKQFYKPMAQFDLVNNIKGNYVGDLNISGGISFYLGDDDNGLEGNEGITHSWTDTTVENGKMYVYAVVSYDRGGSHLGIPPAECSKRAVYSGSSWNLGTNVVVIRPGGYVSGYEPGHVSGTVAHQGTATGNVRVDVIHSAMLPESWGGETRELEIRFVDTSNDLYDNNGNWFETPADSADDLNGNQYPDDGEPDYNDLDPAEALTRVTTGWYLIDITTSLPDTLVPLQEQVMLPQSLLPEIGTAMNTTGLSTLWQPATAYRLPSNELGLEILFDNDWVIEPDVEKSGWNGATTVPVEIRQASNGYRNGDAFVLMTGVSGQSVAYDVYPASVTDFNVSLLNTGSPYPLKYAYDDQAPSGLSEDDKIIILRQLDNGIEYPTWEISFSGDISTVSSDEYTFYFKRPFTNEDIFHFSVQGPLVHEEQAEESIDRVKVVPNPYYAAASWEFRGSAAAASSLVGRGDRRIAFINVPQNATIRIYTVRGDLVQVLKQDGGISDRIFWDLRSKDEIEIAYGVYIFQVSVPFSNKTYTGKFAVIK